LIFLYPFLWRQDFPKLLNLFGLLIRKCLSNPLIILPILWDTRNLIVPFLMLADYVVYIHLELQIRVISEKYYLATKAQKHKESLISNR